MKVITQRIADSRQSDAAQLGLFLLFFAMGIGLNLSFLGNVHGEEGLLSTNLSSLKLLPVPDQINKLGEAVAFNIWTNNSGSKQLQFKLTGAPNGIRIDEVEGRIWGHCNSVGHYETLLTVYYRGKIVSNYHFTWIVTHVPNPNASAQLEVVNNTNDPASVCFRLNNNSRSKIAIQSLIIDFSEAFIPDNKNTEHFRLNGIAPGESTVLQLPSDFVFPGPNKMEHPDQDLLKDKLVGTRVVVGFSDNTQLVGNLFWNPDENKVAVSLKPTNLSAPTIEFTDLSSGDSTSQKSKLLKISGAPNSVVGLFHRIELDSEHGSKGSIYLEREVKEVQLGATGIGFASFVFSPNELASSRNYFLAAHKYGQQDASAYGPTSNPYWIIYIPPILDKTEEEQLFSNEDWNNLLEKNIRNQITNTKIEDTTDRTALLYFLRNLEG